MTITVEVIKTPFPLISKDSKPTFIANWHLPEMGTGVECFEIRPPFLWLGT